MSSEAQHPVKKIVVIAQQITQFTQLPTYRGLSAVSRNLLDGADKPRHIGNREQLSTDPGFNKVLLFLH